MVELTFHEERFDVKLLTLESSRLNGQKSLSPEVIVQIAWHSLYAVCCLPLLLSVSILAFQSSPSFVTTLCSQVYGLFSTECARYKDFIHLNSFMYDFHLNLVLSMLSGKREIPEWLDVKAFLEHFTHENKQPPSFTRNRLERG